MTKTYISLPISGRDMELVRTQADEAFDRLLRLGYVPVSPLDNGVDKDAPTCEHMKADYKLLLGCDAIYLCDGWQYSHGCMDELHVAADCRLTVLTHGMSDGELFYTRRQMEEGGCE